MVAVAPRQWQEPCLSSSTATVEGMRRPGPPATVRSAAPPPTDGRHAEGSGESRGARARPAPGRPRPCSGLSADRRPEREQAPDRLALEADRLAVPQVRRPAPRRVVLRPGRRVLHAPVSTASLRTRSSTTRSPRSTLPRTASCGATAGPASPAPGSGELSNPDDAYVWRNGTVTVADIKNCRVQRIDPAGRVVAEIGSAGNCAHDPPRTLSSPNGATPLPDGGMLVTEIGGWVDRLDARNHLVFSLRTPTSYPSDAQLLPERQRARRRLQHTRPRGRDHASGNDRLDVRPIVRPGGARPALARRALAERDDRRHRRLAPPDRRHRPAHEADRLAVRPSRRSLVCGRIPLEAGRTRPPPGGDDPGPPAAARRHAQGRGDRPTAGTDVAARGDRAPGRPRSSPRAASSRDRRRIRS